MAIFIKGTRFKLDKIASVEDVQNSINIKANFDTTSIPKSDNFVYFTTRAVHADYPNLNGDIFPLDALKKAYRSFVGRNLHLDHDTAVDRAVGKVFDAKLMHDPTARPGQPEYYVECLCGVDVLSAPHVAKRVKSGVIDSVSMGASVEMAECSICHKTATDPRGFCKHLQNLGKKDPETGELCASINHGVSFTELSLVGVPADPMAKMNQVFASALNKIMKTAEDDAVQQSLPEKFSLALPCSNEKEGEKFYNILEKYSDLGISDLQLEGSTLKVSIEANSLEDAQNKLAKISEEQGLSTVEPLVKEENAMADNMQTNAEETKEEVTVESADKEENKVEAGKKDNISKSALPVGVEDEEAIKETIVEDIGEEDKDNEVVPEEQVVDPNTPSIDELIPTEETTDYASLDKNFLEVLLKNKDKNILKNIDMAKVEEALKNQSNPAATPALEPAGAAVNDIIVEEDKSMTDKTALPNPLDAISPDMGIAKEIMPAVPTTPAVTPTPVTNIYQTQPVVTEAPAPATVEEVVVADPATTPATGEVPVVPAALDTSIAPEAKPEDKPGIPEGPKAPNVTPPAASPLKPEPAKPDFNKGPEEVKKDVPGDRVDGEFDKEEVIKILEDLKKQETSEGEPAEANLLEKAISLLKGKDKKEENKKEEPKADDSKPSNEQKEDKKPEENKDENKGDDKKEPENKEASAVVMALSAGKTALDARWLFKVQGQKDIFLVAVADLVRNDVVDINKKAEYLISKEFVEDVNKHFASKKSLDKGSVLEIAASYNQKIQNKSDEACSKVQTSNKKAPSETDKTKGVSKVEEQAVGVSLTDTGKAQKSAPEHKDEKASGHETSSKKAPNEKLNSVEALQQELELAKKANAAKDEVIEFFRGKFQTEAQKNLDMDNQHKMAQKLAKVRNIVDMTLERNLLQVNEDYRKEAFQKSASAIEASKVALQKTAEDLAADLLGLSDEELDVKAKILKQFKVQASIQEIKPMTIQANLSEVEEESSTDKQIKALSANMQ